MKVVGLITEYNPFHNGHKYHIEEAKRITGADYVIAVMSGDFVQRGTPAIIDKYSRTAMALKNGVDLVLELPVCFATGSAEIFAHGAVSILSSLGIVDYLCFGSEAGDMKLLQETAELMLHTSDSYDQNIQLQLKNGLNYPAARQKALMASLDYLPASDKEALSVVLNEPNNILGIEYIKAIHNLSSPMQPVTISRASAHYHEQTLTNHESVNPSSLQVTPSNPTVLPLISSATAIRREIQPKNLSDTNAFTKIEHSVPPDVFALMTQQYQKTCPVTEEDFSRIIKYKLLAEDSTSLATYMDISADLAERMKKLSDLNLNIDELSDRIKSKNFTRTRVNRALIHLLLNIHTDDMECYKLNNYNSYARVLGIRKMATPLLRKIRLTSKIPVITKVAKAEGLLSNTGNRMLHGDIFASHLYQQTVYEKFNTKSLNEYRRGVIII
jgi:predicted nucleotidyltransferase